MLYETYVVRQESNDTECMARQLANLWPHLRHQPRHTFLLDDQYKFQLDSINMSDLTASCVCVVVTRYGNGETKSRAALRDQILCHT